MSIGGAIFYYFPKYAENHIVLMTCHWNDTGDITIFYQNKHIWEKNFTTTVSHIGFGVFIMEFSLVWRVYKQYIALSQNNSSIEK